MNGAESLVRTLVDSGVEVCFSNPGTSEMHFVAALDKVGMRAALALNRVDRRSTRRSNGPGRQAAFCCRKLLYRAVSKSMYPPNDTGSPNGRICVAQKPPKPFLRSIQ
jgi:hypothetical protein